MGEGWLGSHHPLFPTLTQLPRKPGFRVPLARGAHLAKWGSFLLRDLELRNMIRHGGVKGLVTTSQGLQVHNPQGQGRPPGASGWKLVACEKASKASLLQAWEEVGSIEHRNLFPWSQATSQGCLVTPRQGQAWEVRPVSRAAARHWWALVGRQDCSAQL